MHNGLLSAEANFTMTAPPVAQLNYATKEQRCINFIIDNLFMKFSLAYLTGIAFSSFVSSWFPSFATLIFDKASIIAAIVVIYMVSRVNYAIYYTICENFFNGYTVGKLVTGTRAVQADGRKLTLKHAIHRSFSRFLPFEFLSGFSKTPWHDSWTGTTVVKSK